VRQRHRAADGSESAIRQQLDLIPSLRHRLAKQMMGVAGRLPRWQWLMAVIFIEIFYYWSIHTYSQSRYISKNHEDNFYVI